MSSYYRWNAGVASISTSEANTSARIELALSIDLSSCRLAHTTAPGKSDLQESTLYTMHDAPAPLTRLSVSVAADVVPHDRELLPSNKKEAVSSQNLKEALLPSAKLRCDALSARSHHLGRRECVGVPEVCFRQGQGNQYRIIIPHSEADSIKREGLLS